MMTMNNKISFLTKKYADYAKESQIYLHENPEVSSKEFETSKYLKNELKDLGLEIVEVEGTGFFAVLDTKRNGKTLALRADIDALPMIESEMNENQRRKFISKNPGVMHACGHDAHMAILLGAIRVLVELKDELKGKILFLFEEGEEIGAGVGAMMEGIESYNVDGIYGNHVMNYIPSGKFVVNPGPTLPGASAINIKVIGRGGHGARPDLSINPLMAGVQIISNLATAWTNQLDPRKMVTFGLTKLECNTSQNIFADEANIGGSIRYFDKEEGLKALRIIKKVSTLVGKAHNCKVEFGNSLNIEKVGVPLVNDLELTKMAKNSIISQLGEEFLLPDEPGFATEPFARYLEKYPGVYVFIGIKNEKIGSGASHHNVHFDIDPDAIPLGIRAMGQFAVDFLAQ